MKNPAKSNLFYWLALVIVILSTSAGFYYFFTRLNQLSSQVESLNQLGDSPAQITQTRVDECGEDCKEKIEEIVNAKLESLPQTLETVVEKTTVITETSSQTSYIPLGTTGTTTNTDWVDVEDSAVYIDLENDYAAGAVVSWEASLKVAHGNGEAFARLFDDTNKIAVDFSELSTENNVNYKQVSSGNLPLWKGRNLYKVQIKSLNSFEVTYSGGRIKVSY